MGNEGGYSLYRAEEYRGGRWRPGRCPSLDDGKYWMLLPPAQKPVLPQLSLI